MLKKRRKLISWLSKTLDILLTAGAFWLAYSIKKYYLPGEFSGLLEKPNYPFVFLLTVVVFHYNYRFFHFYEQLRKQTIKNLLIKISKAVSLGIAIVILTLYILKVQDVSRIMMGIFVVLDVVFLVASKYIIFHALSNFHKRGFNLRNVLFAGNPERLKHVIETIRETPGSGYRILGCLIEDKSRVGSYVVPGIKVLGTLNDLKTIVLNNAVDEIIITFMSEEAGEMKKIIPFTTEVGINVRIMLDWQIQETDYLPECTTMYVDQFLGLPSIALSSISQKSGQLMVKGALDFCIAWAGLVILSPLFLIIAAAIKLTSRGPVLYKQERCGVNGRKFILYKFRTMVYGADNMVGSLLEKNEMDGPVFKMQKDPRVIPLGRFLRKMSLDELPQLINVIKGEMSLVGPRPPLSSEVERYKPWQRRRLSMKPGITCIWQVCGRNDVGFETWMKMDLEYIDKWSLLLDLKLLVMTLGAVVSGTGR